MNAKLIGFKLVGAHYNPSNGVRYPGYNMVTVRYNDGTERTMCAGGDDKPLAEVCKELNGKGVDTSAVDHWVKTGEWVI